jgi:hypothetical protein
MPPQDSGRKPLLVYPTPLVYPCVWFTLARGLPLRSHSRLYAPFCIIRLAERQDRGRSAVKKSNFSASSRNVAGVRDMKRKLISALAALYGSVALIAGSGAAQAQASNDCAQLQSLLVQRQGLIKQMNLGGKAKMTPQQACSRLGALTGNGARTLTFINTNKDWCRIPDEFVANFKNDHQRTLGFRGQACRAVTQQAVLQRRAAQAQAQATQRQGGDQSGFSGADSITGGPMRVPQGAL